jgi:hypothetical protein
VYRREEREDLLGAPSASLSIARPLSGQFIKPSGIRDSALSGLARTFWSLPVVVVRLRINYPTQLQAIAEILAVCRLGDEPRSASGEQSQSVFANGIDVKNFLQIEDVAISLIFPSSDAKEFLGPQAGQSALEDEGLSAVRRRQCYSQHAHS